MTPTQMTATITALPWEQAERFNWRSHALRRARLTGQCVVSLPCPATDKWIVVPTDAMREDFYHALNALKNYK